MFNFIKSFWDRYTDRLASDNFSRWLKDNPDATEDQKIAHICEVMMIGWRTGDGTPDLRLGNLVAKAILTRHYAEQLAREHVPHCDTDGYAEALMVAAKAQLAVKQYRPENPSGRDHQ